MKTTVNKIISVIMSTVIIIMSAMGSNLFAYADDYIITNVDTNNASSYVHNVTSTAELQVSEV